MDNWMKAKGEVLHGDEFFPPLAHAGSALAQAVKSSPGLGNQSMRLTFLLRHRQRPKIDPGRESVLCARSA